MKIHRFVMIIGTLTVSLTSLVTKSQPVLDSLVAGSQASQAQDNTPLLSPGVPLELEQGGSFAVKLRLDQEIKKPAKTDEGFDIYFNVVFCICKQVREQPQMRGAFTPVDKGDMLIGRGELTDDRHGLVARFRLDRHQPLGTYSMVLASLYIGAKKYDFPPEDLKVIVTENPTYTAYQPPLSLTGKFQFDLDRRELLLVRIAALHKSLGLLNGDLEKLRNGSAVQIRARLQRSLHDESVKSAETEEKYLSLTTDPKAKDAVRVAFADVQQRYTALEKANQRAADFNERVIAVAYSGLPTESESLKRFQVDLETAMEVNIEIFTAMADNGDYIPNVIVQTAPEKGAQVVCRTKMGDERKANGVTDTSFENFPYGRWHCLATKGLLNGATDYDSAHDTHYLIQIPLQ